MVIVYHTNKLRIYYMHAFLLSFRPFFPSFYQTTIQQSLFIQMEYESCDTPLFFIHYARFKLNVCKL